MTDSKNLDPGAYIGHEPELESETIPGGVRPQDERVAAYASQPGHPGEPEGDAPGATLDVEEGADDDRLTGQQITGGEYGSTPSDANQLPGESTTPSPSSSSGGD